MLYWVVVCGKDSVDLFLFDSDTCEQHLTKSIPTNVRFPLLRKNQELYQLVGEMCARHCAERARVSFAFTSAYSERNVEQFLATFINTSQCSIEHQWSVREAGQLGVSEVISQHIVHPDNGCAPMKYVDAEKSNPIKTRKNH